MHCGIITTAKLINIPSYHIDTFLVRVARELEIYSLSESQGHNTLFLTIVTILYVRFPELIHLIPERLKVYTC